MYIYFHFHSLYIERTNCLRLIFDELMKACQLLWNMIIYHTLQLHRDCCTRNQNTHQDMVYAVYYCSRWRISRDKDRSHWQGWVVWLVCSWCLWSRARLPPCMMYLIYKQRIHEKSLHWNCFYLKQKCKCFS